MRHLEEMQNRSVLERGDEIRAEIAAKLEDIRRKQKKQDEFFSTDHGQEVMQRIIENDEINRWKDTGGNDPEQGS